MAGRTGRRVARQAAFWDASALVSLCVGQGATPQAQALYRDYEVVAWWATPVEIASALARLVRMRQLTPEDWTKAREAATILSQSWFLIQPSDVLRSRAERLVNHYDLRAADALQLAAALEWCTDSPEGRPFFTLDLKLKKAALLNGFDTSQF